MSGAGQKSVERERSGERASPMTVERERSAEREVAERLRSGERGKIAHSWAASVSNRPQKVVILPSLSQSLNDFVVTIFMRVAVAQW